MCVDGDIAGVVVSIGAVCIGVVVGDICCNVVVGCCVAVVVVAVAGRCGIDGDDAGSVVVWCYRCW